jgi:hypothetical protein
MDLRERWKVTCENCGSILEAGTGEAYVEHPRQQLACPSLWFGASPVDACQRPGPRAHLSGEWPEQLTSAAIGAPLQAPPEDPFIDRQDEDVIGWFFDDEPLADRLRPSRAIARDHIDPRAPEIDPDLDEARRSATAELLGPDRWKAIILRGPRPTSTGGYAWVGDIGQIVQLIWEAANTGADLLSKWGGAVTTLAGAAEFTGGEGYPLRLRLVAARRPTGRAPYTTKRGCSPPGIGLAQSPESPRESGGPMVQLALRDRI